MESIRLLAARSKLISSRIKSWRIFDNFGSCLKYCYWRNRWPVLNKIFTRAILLFEIYLLSRYYHERLAVSFALIFFCYYSAHGIYKGIQQLYRVNFMESRSAGANLQVLSKIYSQFLIFSAIYATAAGGIIWAVTYLLNLSGANVFFALLLIPLFIIELIASSAWCIVYTEQRLRRSFLVSVLAGILPALMLITFHDFTGIKAYFAGYAIGQVILQVYLFLSASDVLSKKGIKFRLRKLSLKKLPLSHIYFRIPFEIYNCALFFMLFLYKKELALLHFKFISCSHILSYPIIRAAGTYKMDYFLSVKNYNFKYADKYRRKSEMLGFILLGAVIIFSSAMFLLASLRFGIINNYEYLLFPYLILTFSPKALFELRLNSLIVIGAEKLILKAVSVLFITAAFAQAYFLFVKRVNLQAVYFSEFILYVLSVIFVYKKYLLGQSNLLKHRIEEINKDRLLPAGAVPYVLQDAAGTQSHVLVLLHERYKTHYMQNAFLDVICAEISPRFLKIKLCSRLYIISLDNALGAAENKSLLLKKYSFHIRHAGEIHADLKLLSNNLKENIHPAILPKAIKKVIAALQSNRQTEVKNFIENSCNLPANADNLHEIILEYLGRLGIKPVSYIFVKKGSFYKSNLITKDFLDEFLSLNLINENASDMFSILPGQLICFEVFRQPVLLIDGKSLNEGYNNVRELSILWNLYFHVKLFSDAQLLRQFIKERETPHFKLNIEFASASGSIAGEVYE